MPTETPPERAQGGVGDNSHVDAAGVNGVQGVGEVELERPSAHGGVVDVLRVHVQVIGEVQAAVAHGHGGGEKAVDVLLGQPGVLQRLDDAFALNLELALVRGVASNVLVDADDGRRPSEINHGQGTSGLVGVRGLSLNKAESLSPRR